MLFSQFSLARIALVSTLLVFLGLLYISRSIFTDSLPENDLETPVVANDPILQAVDADLADSVSLLATFSEYFAQQGEAQQSNQLLSFGVSINRRFEHVGPMVELHLNSSQSIEDVLPKLRESGFVSTLEPNYWIESASIPSVTSTNTDGLDWGLHNTGQTGGRLDADIDAPEAWEKYQHLGKPTYQPVVALLDTAIDPSQLSVAKHIEIHSSYSICPNPVNADHGAHLAHIISELNPAQPLVIKPITVLCLGEHKTTLPSDAETNSHKHNYYGTHADAVSGLNYLLALQAEGQPIDVVNMSWGSHNSSTVLRKALEKTVEKGMLLIAAAGNQGMNLSKEHYYPASYSLPGVITVAASDHHDELAHFSNYSDQYVEIAAPGVAITPTLTSALSGNKTLSGTSLSAAHVSGVAALIKSLYPSLSAADLKKQLIDSADNTRPLSHKVLAGNRLNASHSLWAPEILQAIARNGEQLLKTARRDNTQYVNRALPATIRRSALSTEQHRRPLEVDIVSHRVMMRFTESYRSLPLNEREALLQPFGVSIVKDFPYAGGGVVLEIIGAPKAEAGQLPPGESQESVRQRVNGVIDQLTQSGLVDYAEPDYVVQSTQQVQSSQQADLDQVLEYQDQSNFQVDPQRRAPIGHVLWGDEPIKRSALSSSTASSGTVSSDTASSNVSGNQASTVGEANALNTVTAFSNDARANELWGLQKIQLGQSLSYLETENLPTEEVVVAVLDSGIDYNHPDLQGRLWVNTGEIANNGIDDDGNGYIDDIHGINVLNHSGNPYDDYLHGTHVSGIIGAVGDNAEGIVGINPHVKIMSLKFLQQSGSASISDAITALNYLYQMKQERGVPVRIINASWGIDKYSQVLYDAIAAGAQHDMLFVASAGNGGIDYVGDNNDRRPHYPSGYELGHIISVTATNEADELGEFANYGLDTVDLAAPGVNILSTLPNGAYGLLSGTSMAAPHVTGAASLLLSLEPSLAALAVKKRLLDSADVVAGMVNRAASHARLNVSSIYKDALLELDIDTSHISMDKGGQTSIGIRMRRPPTINEQMVNVVALLGAEAFIDVTQGAELQFTNDNWDQWQTITLKSINTDRPSLKTLLLELSTANDSLKHLFINVTDTERYSNFCQKVSTISYGECEALVSLYVETNGEQWTNSYGWLVDTDPCQWAGVTCFYGTVSAIELPENNLSGKFPSSLTDLPFLYLLNLGYNHLVGEVPDELGQLNLLSLILSYNHLYGTLPTTMSAYLSEVDLSGNAFSGAIPEALLSGSNLSFVNLSDNAFTGTLPDNFSKSSQLTYLFVNKNQLTGGVPESLGNLAVLEVLDVSNNKLNGTLPSTLSKLSNLYFLDASHNQLTGSIPNNWYNLSSLAELDLGYNQFSGNVPASLGSLSSLQYLYLPWNNLSGQLPETLGGMSKLRKLVLQGNQLSGSLPNQLGSLSQLQELVLSENIFTGEIPETFSQLSKLTKLFLSDNRLSGAMPASLGDMVNLEQFSVYSNKLTGSLPSSFDKLTRLEILLLGNNEFSGDLHSQVYSLSSTLSHLWLEDNKFTGTLPAGNRFPNLVNLNVSGNQLSGTFPTVINQFDKLQYLDVSYNQLSGTFPDTLLDLQLFEINVNYNALETDNELVSYYLYQRSQSSVEVWDTTQAVPPEDIKVNINDTFIGLEWSPTAYSNSTGEYIVSYSLMPEGPFEEIGRVIDTESYQYRVEGAPLDVSGYYQIQTQIPPQGRQQNTLQSRQSATTLLDIAPPTLVLPEAASLQGSTQQGLERSASSVEAFLSSISATDSIDGVVEIVTHNAPEVLPYGETLIEFTACDQVGNCTSATQSLEIVDRTGPTITADTLTLEAAGPTTNVDFGVIATDIADGEVAAVANIQGPFGVGVHTIEWTARDSDGNISTITQQVIIRDTTAPTVTAPVDIVAEATGTLTTVDLGTPQLSDIVDDVLSAIPDNPGPFALGEHEVYWTVTDTAGNSVTVVQKVTVQDTTAPTFASLEALTIEASGEQTVVELSPVSAIDVVDGSLTATANKSGSFALGVHTIQWSVTDAAGNTGTAEQTLTVQDTIAPVIPALQAVSYEATAVESSINFEAVFAADVVDGTIEAVVEGADSLRLGDNVVTWRAVDAAGNVATQLQTVTITDTVAPVIAVPETVHFSSVNQQTSIELNSPDIQDIFPVTITHNAPDLFPVGDTVVTWTATDSSDNRATAEQVVKVGPYVPNQSTPIFCEVTDDVIGERIWVANPDNDEISMIHSYRDEQTGDLQFSVNEEALTFTDGSPSSITVLNNELMHLYKTTYMRSNRKFSWATDYFTWTSWRVNFAWGQAEGIVGHGDYIYMSFYKLGEIIKVNVKEGHIAGRLKVGALPKAMALTRDGSRLLVTRFISDENYAEVYDINTAGSMSFTDPSNPSIKINKVLVPDSIDHGSGVPNYLRGIVIDEQERYAYVTANKSNIDRGEYVSGEALTPENTVRSMLIKIDLHNRRDANVDPTTREGTFDLGAVADPSAITFLADGKTGVYALRGSNRVRSLDGRLDIQTGGAPTAMCATAEALYIKNYTDRTVTVVDLKPYYQSGITTNLPTTHLVTVRPENEILTPEQLKGLQLFYHARQPDLSLDGFFTCASCHDGGTVDGMSWDFTQLGEGVRNTPTLWSKAEPDYGTLNWSGSMDEISDVEFKLELLYGTNGLIEGRNSTDHSGPTMVTSGRSNDLDALSAYVGTLKQFLFYEAHCIWGDTECNTKLSGYRSAFRAQCYSCHEGHLQNLGGGFHDNQSYDVGTISDRSGKSAGQPLVAIRTAPLEGLAETAPYLHDGSAKTLEEVFQKGLHADLTLPEDREGFFNYLLIMEAATYVSGSAYNGNIVNH